MASFSVSTEYIQRLFEGIRNFVSDFPNPLDLPMEESERFKNLVLDCIRNGLSHGMMSLSGNNSSDGHGRSRLQSYAYSDDESDVSMFLDSDMSDSGAFGINALRNIEYDSIQGQRAIDSKFVNGELDLSGRTADSVNWLRTSLIKRDDLRRLTGMSSRQEISHEEDFQLMEEDEEHELPQDEESPEENSETSLSLNFNETINNLQSFQRSVRDEFADFNVKMEELRELMLETYEMWKIISKKLKGIPVMERRKDMLQVLLSDYRVCFDGVNIKKPPTYQQLVDNVFPKVSLKQKQALMSYFAGAVVGNRYFKELMNSLAEVHENFCGEDYCKVR